METLDTLHPIKAELLSPKYYFQSLVEQARHCGLLSEGELAAIQTDLLLLLAEQTDKWGRGGKQLYSHRKSTGYSDLHTICGGNRIKVAAKPGAGCGYAEIEALEGAF